MAGSERKRLVWDIRKTLHNLTATELYQVAEKVGPVAGRDQPDIDKEDPEDCYDYISSFMNKEMMDCTEVRERETRIYDSERPGRMLSQDQPSTSSSSNVVLDYDDLPEDVLDVLDIPMPSVPTFQHNENVLVYMAGYIGEKVVGKFGSCSDCALFTTADYTSTDSRYTFLRGKQYSDLTLGENGLKVPSTEFVEFIIALETNFRHNISSVIHAVGLGEKLLNSGMEVYSKCRDVVCKMEKCKNTLVYIIKLFNRVRIHHILRT